MLHKISAVTFTLVMILLFSSIPVFAAAKVELDTSLGWNSADPDISWGAGFVMSGDWSLGPNWAFFLKDTLSASQAEQEWQGTLDRCYIRYERGAVRANLGRQGVTWGIGWFFRPTDLITPIVPLAEEATRPGKDLAVLRWSTSSLTATDFIAGDRIYAARTEWRIGPTNLRLLGLYQAEDINAVGFDFQGGLAGLYGEGAYRWADGEDFDQGRFAGLIGWKKIVFSGSQLFVEYFRNELSGADSRLADLLSQNKNQAQNYANRNYLAVGLQVPWDQLTTFAITGISNLDDGGIILTGTVTWQLTDNLDIRGTLMTTAGPEGTEFNSASSVSALVELKYYF